MPGGEDIDVSWIPHLFDRQVKKINHELGKQRAALGWRFFQTLSHFFALPELLDPVRGLDVQVAWGRLRVSEDAVVLAVSFHTKVARRAKLRACASPSHRLPSRGAATVAPLARRMAKPAKVNVPLPIAVAGGAALLE